MNSFADKAVSEKLNSIFKEPKFRTLGNVIPFYFGMTQKKYNKIINYSHISKLPIESREHIEDFETIMKIKRKSNESTLDKQFISSLYSFLSD